MQRPAADGAFGLPVSFLHGIEHLRGSTTFSSVVRVESLGAARQGATTILKQWSAQIKAANIEKGRLRKMPGVHARIFLHTLCDLQWEDACDDGHVSSGMFVSDLLRQLQDRGCALASSTEAFYSYYGGEGSAAAQVFYAMQEAYRETKSTISGWALHFATGTPNPNPNPNPNP